MRAGWGQRGPPPPLPSPPLGEAAPLPETHLVIAGASGPCAALPGPLGL